MTVSLKQCGFCERVLDAGGELFPVYVGERPSPRPVVARATSEEVNKRAAFATADEMVALGYSLGEVNAVLAALDTHDRVAVEVQSDVREVYAVGSENQKALAQSQSLTYDVDRGKVGAEIRVEPEIPKEEPSLRVCKYCRDTFQNSGGGV